MQINHEKRVLKEIEKLNGKYKFTHDGSYDGRRQTTALIKIDGKYYQGSSQCSFKDTFDRKIGRAISLGRAFHNYLKGDYIDLESISSNWRFKEDVDKT